ncbi:hypothetical protein EI94DRAFT_1808914 [Lactarius quietus]|nr:hypothetical protein EI94DRAFT_1808914 [Lactarius quietus]
MRNDTLTDNQGATFEDEGLQSVAAESTGNESGSEYKGSGDESDSESDAVDVIEEPNLEDEEPDTNIWWKSITKIQDIHSAPSPRANAANKSQKKKEISYESLPQGTKHQFKTQIIPIALDMTSALKPWNAPSDESIIEIWNLMFGDKYPLNDGDNECYCFVVAQTLIKRTISSWVHKFADIAEKALINEFAQQGLQTREERATLVQTLLGDADNMSDKKHPFIWELAYDDPSAWPEGIFQGRLIACTFFGHVQVINTVDASYRVQEKPIGALIYAIQAVHRALLYSVTGALELPTDKKSAEFSKTNWGDYTLVTPRSEKAVKCASIFLNKISTLKDQQWDDIFEKAITFQAMVRKQCVTAREPDIRESELVGEGLTDSESDDEELLDPRYDNVTIEEGP